MTRLEDERVDGSQAYGCSEALDSTPSDLEAELLAAEKDFEKGDYLEVTLEQLEHCAKTGESPWPDESHG